MNQPPLKKGKEGCGFGGRRWGGGEGNYVSWKVTIKMSINKKRLKKKNMCP